MRLVYPTSSNTVHRELCSTRPPVTARWRTRRSLSDPAMKPSLLRLPRTRMRSRMRSRSFMYSMRASRSFCHSRWLSVPCGGSARSFGGNGGNTERDQKHQRDIPDKQLHEDQLQLLAMKPEGTNEQFESSTRQSTRDGTQHDSLVRGRKADETVRASDIRDGKSTERR